MNLDNFLSWVDQEDEVIFTYECNGKNFVKDSVISISFSTPKSKEIFELSCPVRKRDNQNFLRIIRKALFELKQKTIFTFNLKDFLNYIPGSFTPMSENIYDVQLIKSLTREPEDDDFFYSNPKDILKIFKREFKKLKKKQFDIYKNITLPSIWMFSDIEKNGMPNRDGLKSYSYYKIFGTVSGRLTNECLNDKYFINPLNIEKEQRGIIKAPPGYKLIVLDYNAMEMRVLAYLSSDPILNHIFRNKKDVYNIIGQFLFGNKDISDKQRQITKNLCFLIIYGGTKYGFAEKNACSLEDADNIIRKFFGFFPKVEEWILKTQIDILNNYSVESLLGRKRIFNKDANQDLIVRQGQNFKVQSFANDITLLGMIELQNKLLEDSKIIINIHDSIVILSPDYKTDGNIEIIKKSMAFPEKLSEFNITNDLVLNPIIKVCNSWE